MNDKANKIGSAPAPARLNLKARILVPLLVVPIILSLIVASGIYRLETEHMTTRVRTNEQSMRQVYAMSLEIRAKKLGGVITSILENDRLLKAFKTGNRQALLEQARPLFERLQHTAGITHFYFHSPDRVNLMRIHLPNHFGDVINRQTLLNAASSGETAYGAEVGSFGAFALRAVAPWYDHGALVGYIEFGASLDDIIETFIDMFGVEPYMLMSKNLVMRERWQGMMLRLDRPSNWDLLPTAVIIAGAPRPMPQGLIDILALRPLDSSFSNEQIVDDKRTYITGEIILKDVSDMTVGKLIMLTDITRSLGELNLTMRVLAGVAAVLGALVLAFFYLVLNNAERLFTASHDKIVADAHAREQLQSEHIAELERLALFDPLTDLPNRQLLQDRIDDAIVEARRGNYPLALAVLNLSRLREINNTLGHNAGDVVLKQIARRLQEALRSGNTIARLGGDEFGVMMPKTDRALAELTVAKLQALLEVSFDVEGIPVSISASFGIAFYPEDSADTYHLIQHADVAMREARRLHRGIVIYNADHDPYSLRKVKLFSELASALVKRELFLQYQPKADMNDPSNIKEVEALVRWQHPTEGLISPAEFVPLIEKTALITTLTRYVMEEALRQCARWKKQGTDIRVSVNISVFDLYAADFAQHISDLLKRFGLTPANLMLEVTENTVMEEPETTIRVLSQIKEMGVELSIDDFGTGHSSLAYLQRLPVTELKIDRSFICDMINNTNDETIVRSTIQLAHSLGLRVVGEGIEDRETWDMLHSLGCDIIQGYYVSPPLLADDLSDWLDESGLRQQVGS